MSEQNLRKKILLNWLETAPLEKLKEYSKRKIDEDYYKPLRDMFIVTNEHMKFDLIKRIIEK